jgi:hypothetical protein
LVQVMRSIIDRVAFTPLTSLALFSADTAAAASAPSPPPAVKERPMMEAMKREDRPMMQEERPVVESVTSPAAPHNVLDRRNRLCCERRGPGRSNQCLGVIRYQESCRKDCRRRDGSESELTHLCLRFAVAPFRAFRTSKISLFIFSKRRALETKAAIESSDEL